MNVKEPYALVVGGANVDIRGTPRLPLVAHDSNPGTVTTSFGGVGRNICHNMALLGMNVSFLTALGDDHAALRLRSALTGLGIGLTYALEAPNTPTSTYLFITDHQGEMELAVSDMALYASLTPAYLESKREAIDNAALVVADANLTAEALGWLAQNCTCPLLVDPVSTAKAEKVRPILGKLHTLKPNRLEASLLAGVDIVDEVTLQLAAGKLLETGMERVFISLGPDGALCADKNGLCHLPCYPSRMVNATGCGDAFMAAVAWGMMEHLSLEDTGRAGLAAASVALAGKETINEELSAEKIRAILATK